MIVIAPSSAITSPVTPDAPGATPAVVSTSAPASLRTTAGGLALQLGQVLGATVLRGGAAGGTVSLQVAGQTVDARSTLALSAGQQLNLNVTATGRQTVLQILDGQVAQNATALQGLRAALPRSAPLPVLFEALARAVTGGEDGGDARLPLPVREAARALVEAIPSRHSLQPADGLQQALKKSGLFMESQAVRQPPGSALPPGDLKAALMRLASAIREQLPAPMRQSAAGESAASSAATHPRELPAQLLELGRASEAAVYRVQSQQLQHGMQRNEQPTALAVELPVRSEQQTEILRLRVAEDGRRRDDGDEPTWQVVLDLDLGTAGPLQAHLTLRGGTVSTLLRIAHADTAAVARETLVTLERGLREAGVEVGTLHCLRAEPLAAPEATIDSGTLLEVQA